MKKALSLILAFSIAFASSAQKNKKESPPEEVSSTRSYKQKRIELKLSRKNDKYYLFTLESGSLAAVYSNQDHEYVLAKYDKNLKKEYIEVLNTESGKKKLEIKSSSYSNGAVYILFGVKGTYLEKYKIMRFDLESQKQEIISGKTKKPLTFSKMVINKNIAFAFGEDNVSTTEQNLRWCCSYAMFGLPLFLGSMDWPTTPSVEIINFDTKAITNKRFDRAKKTETLLIDGDYSEKANEGYILFKGWKSLKSIKTYIRQFKYENGKVKATSDVEIKADPSKVFIETKINVLNTDDKLIFGNYQKKTSWKKSFAEPIEGIYISRLTGKKQVFTKFIPYADIKTFEFKPPAASTKGKEDKPYGTSFVGEKILSLHDIIVNENGYFIIGEQYIPHYHLATYTSTSNGHTTSHTIDVLDGYISEKCIVMSLDKSGNLLWDDAFELQHNSTLDISTNTLVSIASQSDKLRFTYFYNDRICTRSLQGNSFSEIEGNAKVENKKKSDKVNTKTINIHHLYETTYVVYGHAEVTQKKEEKESVVKKLKRKFSKTPKVLYINKLDIGDEIEDDEKAADAEE
jgi:hypothetical protein